MRCELLDPLQVQVLPAYRLRHAAAFTGAEFVVLKASMASMGGNVQPIKVRARQEASSSAGAGPSFDLVFGSRRLQAARELGLPVRAVVVDALSDLDLVAELVASNVGEQVSLFELGGLLSRVLNAGLFPSRRRMAEHVFVPLATAALAVDLAELPLQLFAAFRDPRAITVRQAQKLVAAARQDPAAFGTKVGRTAAAVPREAREVLQELLA